jgi:hypothetical protein
MQFFDRLQYPLPWGAAFYVASVEHGVAALTIDLTARCSDLALVRGAS